MSDYRHTAASHATPVRAVLWLMVALSSVVFIEPAPCDVLGAGLLVLTIVLGLRIPRGAGLAILLAGLFVLGNLVASAFAPEPSVSIQPLAVRAYLFLCWWLLIASMITEAPRPVLGTIWNAYTIAALVAAGIGSLAFFGVVPDSGQLVDQGRVRFLFKDANVYGPFLIPVIIYSIYRLEHVRAAGSAMYMAVMGTLGLGLILGFSRGSWLNFVISLLCFLVFRSRSLRPALQKRRLVMAGTTMILAGIAVIGFAFTAEPVREMLDTRAHLTQAYDVDSQLGGTVSRFDGQARTLRLAMRRPQGIGSGQSEMDYFQGKAPHNLFLHTLVEAGWIGGLAFYAFILLTLWKSARFLFEESELRGSIQIAFASLVGTLAQSLFVDSTHWRHMFLLLAMLWGPLLYLQRGQRVSTLPRTAP